MGEEKLKLEIGWLEESYRSDGLMNSRSVLDKTMDTDYRSIRDREQRSSGHIGGRWRQEWRVCSFGEVVVGGKE